MAVVQLNSIVKNVSANPSGFPREHFPFYLQYAIRGIRDMAYDALLAPKTVVLDLDDDYVANLPKDFVSISKVGMHKCGRLYVLFKVDSLFPKSVTSPTCDDSATEAAVESDCNSLTSLGYGISYQGSGYYFYNYDSENGFSGRVFGYGAPSAGPGAYTYNERAGRLEFRDDVSEPVVLEYLTNGIEPDENKDIWLDERITESLIAFIKKCYCQDSRKQIYRSQLNDWKEEYRVQRRKYARRRRKFTFAELERALRHGYGLHPKA